jgi:hypothetical protein
MAAQTVLNGSDLPVQLAPGGYNLAAPDLLGTVTELSPEESTSRSDAGVHEDRLLEALQHVDITHLKVFEIEVTADTRPVEPATAARSGALVATTREGEPAIVLRVPDLGEHLEYAVLYSDEAGTSRWLWPEGGMDIARPATRGGRGEVVFHLPRAGAPSPSTTEDRGTRGPISKLGRRLVRVLIWTTDSLVGRGAQAVAAYWENSHRQYGFHTFPTRNTEEDVPWDKLQKGRALLLLHGTFSTARSAFSDFPPALHEALAVQYGGRVFAFDHPTLHHSPQENAQEFFTRLPQGASLDLDIVTHSRGGLLGRELIEQQTHFASAERKIRVHKAIFVAAPNLGTILTDGDHGVDLLDRYTNLLTDLPDDAFTLTMEGVLALVKILAHGALVALPGLNCMLPQGAYLSRLNTSTRPYTQYYAVASNFVPTGPGLLARFGSFVAGRFIASVFGEDNDGVVPTRGSYESALTATAFPIPTASRLVLDPEDQVHHCNYFSNGKVTTRIVEWLRT